MAKLKEYPIIFVNFIDDLLHGNFESCSYKLKTGLLYFLDKCLKRDSIIRYFIWRHNQHIKYFEINKSEIKFLILYFYEDKLNLMSYRKFKKLLMKQSFRNYDIIEANTEKLIDKILNTNYSHICFVEQDDLLADHALNNAAKIIQDNFSLELIYSDVDVINRFGFRTKPYFKPQYSPLLLFSHNYMNAFLILKLNNRIVQLIKDTKKLNQKSLYFLVLSLTRDKLSCLRISDVLYHRNFKNAKKLEISSARDIVENEIKERKMNVRILDYKIRGINQLKFYHYGNPKVSIIIPFKDKVHLLKQCIESIEKISTYDNYEILLVNNRSKETQTLNYLKEIKYKIIDADIDFNFSRLNNIAAEFADGDYLILLNNDTKIITEDWIENLLGLAQLPQIGSVGVKLLYKNNKTQHAGIAIGVGLLNRSLGFNEGGYGNYNNLIREYICVSGACMMVSKTKYNEVGGLNEELAIECNDFDFCLKLLKSGYYNIFNPHSMIYHYDSVTLKRKFKGTRKKENNYLMKKWPDYFQNDPFYNPNLSRSRSDFAINIYQN